MENFQHMKIEVDGHLAVLTLNRPEKMNAFGKTLIDEAARAVDLLTVMKEVRVVICTGAGGNFCTGLDIEDMVAVDKNEGLRLIRAVAKILEAVYTSRKITIAAIEGYCLAGGMNLALSNDILVSSDKAVFGQPEINFSFMPGVIRLWRYAGLIRAKYMALTGDLFSAKEVKDWGFISKMVPAGKALEEARKLAEKLLDKPHSSLRTVKMMFTDVMEMDFEEASRREREGFLDLFQSGERKRRMEEFITMRKKL
ncbi:MAG: enoyl-CoA hydratase/isomerase family protein [Deltaproteobacteria bacterium]|nr:enoyl-CoA hydratase/isomerase family protein [Candidatus Zymogenaceae bacterium]